jgi:glucose dehydrogenase
MLHPTLRRGVLALSACAVAGGSPAFSQPMSKAPAFTSAELVRHPAGNWVTNGGNVYNQRYSSLSQINRANVAQVKAVWRTSLNGSGLGQGYSQ